MGLLQGSDQRGKAAGARSLLRRQGTRQEGREANTSAAYAQVCKCNSTIICTLLILGTCCAAARSLVSMLARIEVIQPVRKVNSSHY